MIRESREQDCAAVYARTCEMGNHELPAAAFREILISNLQCRSMRRKTVKTVWEI